MGMLLPSNYITGIVIFAILIMGTIGMIAEFKKYDTTFIDAEKYKGFEASFNQYNNITASIDTLHDSITGADAEWGIFGVLNALINAAWNGIKGIIASFAAFTTGLIGLTSVFGVPSWVVVLITSLITAGILFAIVAAIFQREV